MRSNKKLGSVIGTVLVCSWGCLSDLIAKESFTPTTYLELAKISHQVPADLVKSDKEELTLEMQHFATLSPDGARFSIGLVRGDIDRNGYWGEVLIGRLGALAEARELKTVARLFSKAYKGAYLKTPIWSGNAEVIALWEDDLGKRQLFKIHADTGDVRQLTHHPHSVQWQYVVHSSTVIYRTEARSRKTPIKLDLEKGFTLSNQDRTALNDLVQGFRDHYDGNDETELWLKRQSLEPARLAVMRSFDGDAALNTVRVSPDGNRVVMLLPAASDSWQGYDFSGRHSSSGTLQPHIVEVSHGAVKARPLWTAPFIASYTQSSVMAWSPDGRKVLIAPTFLPPAHASSAAEKGAAVAVVDAESGRYELLPTPKGFLATPLEGDLEGSASEWRAATDASYALPRQRLEWVGRDAVEIVGRDGTALRFKRGPRAWAHVRARAPALESVAQRSGVRLQLRQGANLPPAVYAVEAHTGESKLIFDPTPQLRGQVSLGRVERIRFTDELGGVYDAELCYPVEHDPSRRYPLVIQPYGVPVKGVFAPHSTGTSVYPRQSLASKGMFYLNFDPASPLRDPEVRWDGQELGVAVIAGVRAALQYLDERGLIDTREVGVSGFSNGGLRVLHLLTQSDIPIAAAVASDNVDGSYNQALQSDRGTSIVSGFIGARPFGEGLGRWLELAPGFNLDRVRTPLRMENQSDSLIRQADWRWEAFQRLRHLKLPVELYFVPEFDEHGWHGVSNPKQFLASSQGVVDWYEFWLNEREDPDESKREQYARWRHLRELRDATAKTPRRPLYKWSASPVAESISFTEAKAAAARAP